MSVFSQMPIENSFAKVKNPYRGPLLVRQNLADLRRPGGPVFFRLQMPARASDCRLQNRFWSQDRGEQFK